jgi:hypothetical protein
VLGGGELNKEGMAAEGNTTPPDTTGAIGPSHYVEFVNGTGITVYDRDLDAVSGPVKLGDFIGFPADAVFDPQIQWDANWGRWIYVMDDIEFFENPETEAIEEENYLAFGWSKSADPSGLTTEFPGEEGEAGWCGYFIETGALFDDYPKLGHSDAGITIGSNVFNAEENFAGSRLWSIAKPTNPQSCPGFGEAGLTLGVTELPLETEDGDPAFTPVPANTADSSPNSYVVAADSPPVEEADEIMAWHISGGGAGATLFEDGNMTVEPFEFPKNVPQPLPSVEVLDSLDTRLTNAVAVTDPAVADESVWTQHTINGPGDRSVVRWYELLPDTQTVRQEGEISDAEHFIFNGAISPTKLGDAAAINFNRASDTLFPEMHAQSRDSATPLNQMEGDVLLGSSGGAAQDSSCDFLAEEAPCRWGDYAGASPDPSLAAVVWGSNQGLAAPLLPPDHEDARWTTRNFALVADSTIADLTPPPAPAITATDPTSPANDNSPMLIGTAEAGSTVSVHESADCSGPVVATGPAAAFGVEGIAVAVANDQTTQLSATATDLVGNTSSCSGAFSYTEDSTPPAAPTITGSDPASPANDNNPKLKGNAEAASTVRIYTSSNCSGPITAQGSAAAFASPGFGVSVPDNQTTQFTATATDAVGNTSACSAAFSYTESAPPPPSQPPPPPPGQAQVLGKVALVRGGKALLRMSCPGPGSCQGALRLIARVATQAKRARGRASAARAKRVRNLVIGRASFSIAVGETKLVRVPLTRKGLALLRKAGKRGLKVKLRGSGLVERSLKLKPAS